MIQSTWDFAAIWEAIADRGPDRLAQRQGDRAFTWASMDRRADGLASVLARGATRQARVAQYLYNCPEYLESVFACAKASLVPVNTNYRYRDDELVYLWDNADVEAVIFHAAFLDTVAAVRQRVPRVRDWICVADGTAACPAWAVPYEQAAASGSGRYRPAGGRGGDDLILFYTGGTTGLPKGVLWRQDDLIRAELSLDDPALAHAPADPARLPVSDGGPAPVGLPACPLMHGTGFFTAVGHLCRGGSVVTLTSRSLDAVELLDTIAAAGVTHLSIVGDAFARPIVDALDAWPGRWRLPSLTHVFSSGLTWSEPLKRRLLAHLPRLTLADSLASSEGFGMGVATSTAGATGPTGTFAPGPSSRVVGDDGRDVAPGSGVVGRLAVGGFIPLGYHKDPERSAATFRTIGGARYALPGDWATVDAQGRIILLGRGSTCINTGGEKVFTEEVERVIRRLEAVADCAVVGVPDERFGQAVAAVVAPAPGAVLDPAAVKTHVRASLAAYKAPRHVVIVDELARASNGKVDYRRIAELAADRVAPRATAPATPGGTDARH